MASFCSCPASLVSRKFFAVGPRCAKCFFCCAPLGAATFRRGQSKKKTPPRVFFFFAPAPGKGRGRRSPVGRRHGARAKKKNTAQGVFFFCSGPGERQGKEKPRWAPARGQSKTKNTTQGVFFFCSGTGERQGKEKPRWAPARGQSKKTKTPGWCFFFWFWPRAGAQRGFSFPCLSPGPEQKKNTWVVFFFCSGPVPAPNGASPSLAFRRGRSKTKNSLGGVFFCSGPVPARGFSFPCLSPGPEQNKKHPGWCFFFLLRPRADAHSLTAGLGGDASPSPGWCLFFLLRGGDGPGWCFFFCCGPARTLTHSLWAGAISARPGWCFFFLLRPRRVFLDNNKKCLGYYIGSKKTRRGHSKKKNTTSHDIQTRQVAANLVRESCNPYPKP